MTEHEWKTKYLSLEETLKSWIKKYETLDRHDRMLSAVIRDYLNRVEYSWDERFENILNWEHAEKK
jgi:hypothetical protein